jgi:hypothetical protein
MTENSVTYAGSYKLKAVKIFPSVAGDTRVAVEMRNLVPSLSIVESMTSDSIRGSMSVIDASGLLEKYPIRGEENLYIEMEDALGNVRGYNLFIYRVDNVRMSDNNDRLTYTLYFVSRQRLIADLRRVIASYDKPVSEIVREIYNTYCRNVNYSGPPSRIRASDGFNKDLVIEETEGNVKLIIPRLTPMQAFRFLESRAYSSRSPTSSFRFFESADSFYFVTDEYLVSKAASDDKIFEFSYAANLNQAADYILQRMANFSSMVNVSRVDTFEDMHSGAYKNKVIVLDIVNRTTNIIEPAFDYKASEVGYFQRSEGVLDNIDKHTDNFIASTFNEENARRFLMVRDYAEEDAGQLRGEQFLPQIASNRLSYFSNQNAIKVTSSSPGRLDITCGDLIRLVIPEFMNVSQNPLLNPQLSGVYMVESVNRVFDKDVYLNEYTLVKRKWARQPTGEETFLLGVAE